MPSRGTTAHVRAACAYVVLALTLVGCSGGDPEPTRSEGEEPTATEEATLTQRSPAPSPDAPAQTSGELTAEGAEALVRHFLALEPYAYSTGDLSEWRRLSHPECQYCTSVADGVEGNIANRGTVLGGEVTVLSTTSEVVDPTFVVVTAQAAQEPAVVYDGDGNVVQEAPADKWTVAVAVESVGETWTIRGVELLEEQQS